MSHTTWNVPGHSLTNPVSDCLPVNTLKISKPEKAQMIEGMVCRMAQMGQLPGKMDDAQLVSLLESLNKQIPKSTSTVKFDRRRAAMDSDSDEDYGL